MVVGLGANVHHGRLHGRSALDARRRRRPTHVLVQRLRVLLLRPEAVVRDHRMRSGPSENLTRV